MLVTQGILEILANLTKQVKSILYKIWRRMCQTVNYIRFRPPESHISANEIQRTRCTGNAVTCRERLDTNLLSCSKMRIVHVIELTLAVPIHYLVRLACESLITILFLNLGQLLLGNHLNNLIAAVFTTTIHACPEHKTEQHCRPYKYFDS